jgi:hypothetical protein
MDMGGWGNMQCRLSGLKYPLRNSASVIQLINPALAA